MVKRILLIVLAAASLACQHQANETKQPSGQATVDYAPRIGVAVMTPTRTCMAIQNSTLQPNSQVTLVTPSSPQSFVEAQVTGTSATPCPITREVNPAVTSYDLKPPAAATPTKLMPLIAVVGPAANFSMENVSVQADLDQNGTADTFSACGADDGVHLNVWKGRPLVGTPVWKGYYYEPGNPGTLPACGTGAR
jgi:hypothetical protein